MRDAIDNARPHAVFQTRKPLEDLFWIVILTVRTCHHVTITRSVP